MFNVWIWPPALNGSSPVWEFGRFRHQTPKVSAEEAALVKLLPELDWPTHRSELNPIDNLYVPVIQ